MPIPFEIAGFRQDWWPHLKTLGFAYHQGLAAASLMANCNVPNLKPDAFAWLMAGLCTLFSVRDLGHICLPLSQLPELWQQRNLLLTEGKNRQTSLPPLLPNSGFDQLLLATGMAVWETAAPPGDDSNIPTPLVLRKEAQESWLYLRADHMLEQSLAIQLSNIRSFAKTETTATDTGVAISKEIAKLPQHRPLDPIQHAAILQAGTSGIFLLTGGPGTGKTTTVFHILRALYLRFRTEHTRQPFIALCAPTGRAAARMTESLRSTQQELDTYLVSAIDREFVAQLNQNEGMTLHRLLGLYGSFRREPPVTQLPFDIIIVDEASMIDLYLMHALASRLAPQTKLILVGDQNQLPSVESGAILSELTNTAEHSAALPTANLQTVFRSSTQILECAKAVLHGNSELALTLADNPAMGLHLHRVAVPVQREAQCTQILTAWFKQEMVAAIAQECAQVSAITRDKTLSGLFERANHSVLLSPVHGGLFGTIRLNHWIDQAIRTELSLKGIQCGHWAPGMMVMVVQNDYERGLFNGDRGLVYRQDGALRVYFPENSRLSANHPAPATIPGLEPAYALTIHKSQGSEFDRLHLFLADATTPEGHVSCELLYTGLTRAKTGLTLVIDPAAFEKACTTRIHRWTRLGQRLSDRP